MPKAKDEFSADTKNELIDLVHGRPEVWDTKNKHYSNRVITDQIWSAFDKKLGLADGKARVCWNNLKKALTRKRKQHAEETRSGAAGDPAGEQKLLQKKTVYRQKAIDWPYWNKMQFVSDHIEDRLGILNVNSSYAPRPLPAAAVGAAEEAVKVEDVQESHDEARAASQPLSTLEVDLTKWPAIAKSCEEHEAAEAAKKKKKPSSPKKSAVKRKKSGEDDDIIILKDITETFSSTLEKFMKTDDNVPQDVRVFLDYAGSLLLKIDAAAREQIQLEFIGTLQTRLSTESLLNQRFS